MILDKKLESKVASRRKFLKGMAGASAIALGAPFIVPATVFAKTAACRQVTGSLWAVLV